MGRVYTSVKNEKYKEGDLKTEQTNSNLPLLKNERSYNMWPTCGTIGLKVRWRRVNLRRKMLKSTVLDFQN